jgi:hypothetical protein
MRTFTHAALLSIVAAVVACGSGSDDADSSSADISTPGSIVLQLDPKLPAAVGDRIESLVKGSAAGVSVVRANPQQTAFTDGAHVLAVGDVGGARELIHDDEAARIAPEGFVLRSATVGGVHILATRGKDSADVAHFQRPNRGMLYGAYAALGEVGFGFLHPLAPSKPASFVIPNTPINRTEAPRWHVRGLHIHTQHPIELANLLNGWGQTGTNDEAGFQAMVPEWSTYLEWMIANHQNRVEWSLLDSASWSDFVESDTRQKRLAQVVSLAHTWGVETGADAPIALQQQHAFRLVVKQGELADELASIRQRVGYLMGAGFDYLSTENGTTEFTHADPQRMLAWMNEASRTMREDHQGRMATIKIHCSTGQTAQGFTDPLTGQPLNVNMLPHFADKQLGVMPHTVEHYGIDDPSPTYGNTNFEYMRNFLWQEAGTREVVWHPESAYWVNFDIDVPLFLPIYGDRRVHDLRLLAADEKTHKPMDGQMVFSSGWEWGYWLNDVIAARAAWNPHTELASDDAAVAAVLDDALKSFGPNRKPVIDALQAWMHDEKDLMIYGKHDGQAPSDVRKRNAQAYLQGWDTWSDIPVLAANIPGVNPPKTQPDKLGLVEMRDPVHAGPGYSAEVEPLLAATEKQFGQRAEDLAKALTAIPQRDLADELTDSARITALRAQQVHGLYDYVDKYWESLNPFSDVKRWRKARLGVARTALDQAAAIVKNREANYRVPLSRIGGWGNGPTAYEFGYLWTVHSLFYWWRDEGKAVDAPLSPCYLNTINPADVAMGEGALSDALVVVRKVFDDNTGLGPISACLANPTVEPTFPQDGLRSRP